MTNEEKVRAAWEWYRERFSEPHEGYAQGVYIVQIPMHNFSASTAEEARSAAAAFTDTVIEEARQMRAEMAMCQQYEAIANIDDFIIGCGCCKDWNANDDDAIRILTREQAQICRILSRLQALYDAHVRGLKSEALKGKE